MGTELGYVSRAEGVLKYWFVKAAMGVCNWACTWNDTACGTRHTDVRVRKRCQTPDCSKKRNLWWLISDSIDIWTQRKGHPLECRPLATRWSNMGTGGATVLEKLAFRP